MTTTDNIRGALAEMGVPAERLTDEDILVLVERTNARLTALAAAASSGESNGLNQITLEPGQLMAVIRSVAEEMLAE